MTLSCRIIVYLFIKTCLNSRDPAKFLLESYRTPVIMDASTSDAQNSKETVSSNNSMINQNFKTESSTTIDNASKLEKKTAPKKKRSRKSDDEKNTKTKKPRIKEDKDKIFLHII
ncbi:unnamed protein product [Trichogramma brassicae]|uniref:Uncharacterized protein n=1 Tax=Trichogramma brassicae TaxID=86971 RepID=A0A6H5HVV0_9HYME|nr:unnamed protein product [Trichogramma brassicae]